MRFSSTMSQNYLLAPIQECPSDFLVKEVKLAVLGTGGVGKSDELGVVFLEVSTSDNYQGVCDVFQYLCKEVSKQHSYGSRDKRRSSIIPRPKSPNVQDLKRRFKQALSSKVK
ncbi:ras-like protein family member 11A [Notechis scutatus]|uniref:Ras-like protein family member 11A n=1 Tax=Notechis scutatus TaxID=8663 RepID=A0A6J1UIQ9_9SAUR|nr:ras-like protein family member 11A [Notechis scutatus]